LIEELSNRITILEEGDNFEIKLKPSKNLLIGFFQIVMFLAFGFLLIGAIMNMVFNYLEDNFFNIESIIGLSFFIILTSVGTFGRFSILNDIFFVEESLKLNDDILILSKKGILKNSQLKIRIDEIVELKINAEENSIIFYYWSNFVLIIKDEKEINFFENSDYNDLKFISNFLKTKNLI